jgi:hypothetical protein
VTLPKIRPDFAAPLTLLELSRRMGLDALGHRRLRDYLLRRERVLGTQFLIRGAPNGRYLVTLPLLREHAPELLDEGTNPDRLAEHVAEIDAAIVDLVGRVTALEAQR